MHKNASGVHCHSFQSLVLAGQYGKTAGVLKPFETLSTAQLQKELQSRNIFHNATNKKDLKAVLSKTLQAHKGCQLS